MKKNPDQNSIWNLLSCLCVSGLLVLFACTNSPLGGDEISPRNSEIRGTVQLNNNIDPGGVFVWLDGVNITTRTDDAGEFQIKLPSPASQGSGNGINGAFDLYYYLANYDLATTSVAVSRGEFVFPQGEINSRGELGVPKLLFQNLRIFTDIQPDSIPADSGAVVSISVVLATVEDDTIKVFYPRSAEGIIGPLIIKNLGSGEITLVQTTIIGVALADTLAVDSIPSIRTTLLSYGPNQLQPGNYEVIPFLLVLNDDVPSELIARIGDNVETFGPGYLQIPFRREGGRLTVLEGGQR